MAVTDDERREVARRLRELRLNPWDDAACEIAQCVGIACCNSECHGSNETPECTMTLASRLADLIEPSCDRDALLALAVNLDARATELLKVNDLDQSRQRRSARLAHATDLMAACSRIREALGVVE